MISYFKTIVDSLICCCQLTAFPKFETKYLCSLSDLHEIHEQIYMSFVLVWHKMLTIREHPVLSSGLGDSNRPRISGIHVSFWVLELPV